MRVGLSCMQMSAAHVAGDGVEDSQRAGQRTPGPSLGHLQAHGHREWRRLWPQALGAAIVRQNLLGRA
jgi:hypothetical protein